MKIHFAGGLVVRRGGYTTSISPGYAACCSGDRAVAIRRQGNHSYIRADVNCARCLKVLNIQREET